jgi:hypothetical protein
VGGLALVNKVVNIGVPEKWGIVQCVRKVAVNLQKVLEVPQLKEPINN